MEFIVPKDRYSIDSENSQITLLPPFDTLTKANIKFIKNLSTQEIYFDAIAGGYDFDMAGAVLTYDYDNSHHEDGDDLQIIAIAPFLRKEYDVFTGQSVGASAAVTSDPAVYVAGASAITLMASNGASTDMDIEVLAADTEGGAFIADGQGLSLKDNDSDRIYLQPGVHSIKVRGTNNVATTSVISAKLVATWGGE